MQKKILVCCMTIVIMLGLWIYWTSEVEFNSTIAVLRKYHYFNREYLIEPIEICKNNNFLVILVTSYIGHTELRRAHRKAMNSSLLKSMNAARIFLLAKLPFHEKLINQDTINDESNLYGDMLQGAFIEDYKNLTYKHLMGLQWVSRECATAKFILKVDDDTVFSLERTNNLLLKLQDTPIKTDNFLMGYMLNDTKPSRSMENKWYVTEEEYAKSVYPPYLSGWYYVITPTTAARLCKEAIHHRYFWIDDIFITGTLTEALGITLRHVPKNYWLEYYELLECCLKDMISKHVNCEYSVGPNGGRNNLIVEFNDALRHCTNCSSRSFSEPLNKVCVAFRERSIFSKGKSEVRVYR